MSYKEVITSEEMGRLIEYLDFFQNPDSIFFKLNNGYFSESEKVRRFRDTLYEVGFLVIFDWSQWAFDNNLTTDFESTLPKITEQADLGMLRKLMTVLIRGDRFNEGLFLNAIKQGHVTRILLRLKELKDMDQRHR